MYQLPQNDQERLLGAIASFIWHDHSGEDRLVLRERIRPEVARRLRRRLGNAAATSDLVLEQSIEQQDAELAQLVIADDDHFDGRYWEVHQGILSLLALQAPVAGDLRIVAAEPPRRPDALCGVGR